ncbi:MAG: ABC transporter permease [Turneriella sp.]
MEKTTVITPKHNLFALGLKDLYAYRDLIFMFVKRDFSAIYKQSILGPIWFLIQPLFSTIVFTVIFGQIAKISTEEIPHVLFYMSGVICWNYFSSSLTKTSETFIANQGIFSKVYFPRLTIPISVVMTNLITFAVQFGLFMAFYLYYAFSTNLLQPVNTTLLLVPLLLLQMILLSIGFGILIASMTTKYRDLNYLVGFGMQLWMYATPVVYPVSIIPERFQWLVHLNPMANVIENFRYAFFSVGNFTLQDFGVSFGASLCIFFFGLILFNRVEKSVADTI